MFWGPMISVAMAGALALPATGMAAGRTVDAPPSTDPISSIVGLGLSAIGDVFHAVPILGPLATGAAEQVVCAARAVPVIGGAASSAVNHFDKDQKQKGQCAQGSSATFGSGGAAGAPSSGFGVAQGSASNGFGGLGGGSISGLGGRSAASDAGTQGSSEQSGSSASASAAHHTSASGADHTSSTDHASSSDHASGTDHAPAEISFPKGRFEIRHGGEDDCLVKGVSTADVATALPGRCDGAAAWTYQTDTGELHPADDTAVCLVSPEKNLQMVTVQACATAKSWTKHWYLSATHRLFVRDTDHYDSWRFLGAPGALVVGGVDQNDVPAVPVWTLPAA
jgi:hypothetical protein